SVAIRYNAGRALDESRICTDEPPSVKTNRGENRLSDMARLWGSLSWADVGVGLVAVAAPRASARRRTKTGKQGAGTQEEFPAHLLEPHAERCILRKVARASAAQPAPDRLPRFGVIADHPQRRRDGNCEPQAPPSPHQ